MYVFVHVHAHVHVQGVIVFVGVCVAVFTHFIRLHIKFSKLDGHKSISIRRQSLEETLDVFWPCA